MQKVTRQEVLMIVATLAAGLYSNPANGSLKDDPYARQNILSQTLQDVQNMFSSACVEIIE